MDRDNLVKTLNLLSIDNLSPRSSGSSHRGVSLEPAPKQRLPADEYQHLQTRHTLEKHFSGRSSARVSNASSLSTNKSAGSKATSTSTKKDILLTQEQRLSTSEARYATRKALGPSFDFTDMYVAPKRKPTRRAYDDENEADQEPIPQRYIDELNRRWVKHDIEHDAHQFIMDYLPNSVAPWRQHQPLRPTVAPEMSWNPEKVQLSTHGSMALEMSAHVRQYRENLSKKMEDVDTEKVPEKTLEKTPESSFEWDDSGDEKDEVEEKAKEKRDSKREKLRRKMKFGKK